MYRFNEIWDILIKTELFSNLKKQPYYLKWLLNVAVLLSLIALVIAVLQYLFWQGLSNSKIYTFIVMGMTFMSCILYIYVVVAQFCSLREPKPLSKPKVNFIFFSSDYIQYYEDRAFELCQKYKLYELQYVLNRIHIIFQREENRIDNYNVGWLGFIAPIITLLLNRDVINNWLKNTQGGLRVI
ncbi:unnamed protein product [Commensalibacter communis]|uniref:hypothetical protein n=1 Tax=Commensalibacter communis TaxID=2972786 RepID=UPI0022FFB068|nr:hypothetical protein [Commensalibacter communis]CAI3939029.1 unnamed protein product [Commensalibacter communis]CAI3940312.1 unnamed protein product [Commensalibacter communis]